MSPIEMIELELKLQKLQSILNSSLCELPLAEKQKVEIAVGIIRQMILTDPPVITIAMILVTTEQIRQFLDSGLQKGKGE